MRGVQMGFIAQDVENILPSVILTQYDKAKTKGIKYNELVAVLTNAVQELKLTTDRQAQRIDALGKTNAALSARLDAQAERQAKLERDMAALGRGRNDMAARQTVFTRATMTLGWHRNPRGRPFAASSGEQRIARIPPKFVG